MPRLMRFFFIIIIDNQTYKPLFISFLYRNVIVLFITYEKRFAAFFARLYMQRHETLEKKT